MFFRCEKFLQLMLLAAALSLAAIRDARAQSPSLQELISGVVGVKTFINPDARTTENLGREREGSGIVIDDSGLVLTIGYLMVEAHAAEVMLDDGRTLPASVVGYDHETGFGLLRAMTPLKVRPMTLGTAADLKKGDAVLVVSSGGPSMVLPAHVAAVREFAGSWEYLLERAIFTSPPHPEWSGAALINREGKLIGVGSLIVSDAVGDGSDAAGNMFVPIDMLPPILADLTSAGQVTGPATSMAWRQRRAGKRPAGSAARDARRSCAVGRSAQRRRHCRRGGERDGDAERILPARLGARRGRRGYPARRHAGKSKAPARGSIG